VYDASLWLEKNVRYPCGTKSKLREEAATLAERAKRTARQAEILADRIKHLEGQLAKTEILARTITKLPGAR
jgi:hypothetical protein